LSPSVKELIGHTLIPLLEMYETEDNKLVGPFSFFPFFLVLPFMMQNNSAHFDALGYETI
jgi:hypothetical protein